MNIRVYGNQVLSGTIHPSGSKNAVLALIPATILFDKPVILENVPEIADVNRLVKILLKLGSKVDWDKEKKTLTINNKNLNLMDVTQGDVGSMRATTLLWGPLLGRFKKVDFSNFPGGCTLGVRTLEPHFEAFKDLGVKVTETASGIKLDASSVKAGETWLTEMSPTATENVLMLMATIPGRTRIVGAASEPQVQDTCRFLAAAGVKINGVGSNILEIEGKKSLSAPKRFRISSDHNEIGTFLTLGAVTGGRVTVTDVEPLYNRPVIYELARLGLKVKMTDRAATILPSQKVTLQKRSNGQSMIIRAQPWPALPVDMLPMFIPLVMTTDGGSVLFHNWMYEAGLFWTSELLKLGANIIMCDPHRVIVTAGNKLRGATLEAPYIIRAVVAMVLAAMIARGESTILNADALYRGHPRFAENLRGLGAKIEEIK